MMTAATSLKDDDHSLKVALWYSQSLSWPVAPAHHIREDGRCSCGDPSCSSPGKHPRTAYGFKDATTDADAIRHWWQQWPGANVLIPTGERTGLLVLDIDPDHGGAEALEGLEAEHGALPATVEQATGSGGRHLLFKRTGPEFRNTAGKLGPGLDTRGNGGYIIVPPSNHVSGGVYRWREGRGPWQALVAEAPEWLRAHLNKPKAEAARPPSGDGRPETAYAEAALAEEQKAVATAQPGTRNDRLNSAAFALGQFVGAGLLEQGRVERSLTDAAREAGLEQSEIEPTLASGFQAGMNEPREVPPGKPRLLVENCDPDRTVAALRDILSDAGGLYDRGVPVRLAFDQIQGGMVAQVMTADALVLMAHTACRPYVLKERTDGSIAETDARLSRTFAVMYLDWRGEWRLPPLNGIASSPLLRDDGTVHSARGYDPDSGMWRDNVPDLAGLIPEQPTVDDAAAALRLIRETFKTFCFADAETVDATAGGVALVDTSRAPGKDESAFLTALLTAVCRPSLHLAPGVLLRAAPISGAGAGKGLLARCICIIAFGREPHAVTSGANAEELEKRIAAELMEGSPALFLDNLNNTAFRSNLLASAITERPARVRVLGRSQMVPLNASAFVILTGNGLSVSEDLARRFVAVEFDPGMEDPEARSFATDIRAEVTERRTELLAAVLTIWRWGRLDAGIRSGRPLGSFEQWCRWVRDPLLALGCKDPADRVSEAKERDGRRQAIAELFAIWWEILRDRPVAIRGLHDDVKQAAGPQGRGRQYLAAQLEKLAGTRMAGFVLTRQAGAGKWGAAT